jgi:hypothetical protein
MFTKLTFTILAVALCSSLQSVNAQPDEKKFEVGGQFTMLRWPTHTLNGNSLSEDQANDPGFGGRFGYNFSKYLALEAEVNFFPRDRDLEGGRKVQGLFGVKAGQRFDRFGIFGKARPGFVLLKRGDYVLVRGCIQVFPPPLACYDPVATTNFAIDLGGVLELYPSKRTLIRLDAGDTIVRLGRRNVATFQTSPFFGPSGLVLFPVAAQTKHNLQVSAGFGFRF